MWNGSAYFISTKYAHNFFPIFQNIRNLISFNKKMILLSVIHPKNSTCHTQIIWFFSQFWSKSSHGRTSNITRGNDFQKWLFSWKRQCINFDILWIHDIFTKNILKSRKFWAHSKRNLLFIRYIYTDLLGKTIDIFLAIEQFCFKICPMGNGCCACGVAKIRKILEADHIYQGKMQSFHLAINFCDLRLGSGARIRFHFS